MPSGVIIGLLFPNLTILTKPFAETTVILMLTVSIFRLDPKEILIAFSNQSTDKNPVLIDQIRFPDGFIAKAYTCLLIADVSFDFGTAPTTCSTT